MKVILFGAIVVCSLAAVSPTSPTCEQCGPNERYSNCTNSGCFGALTCAEKGCTKKCNKIKPEDCKKGCICEKGYLRDRNYTCILEEKCPSKCTKPNEVFVECPGTYPARTCGINDCLLKCGKPLEVGDPKCPPPACICASGFFRNPKGDCVKRENCPQCNEPHEVFDICLTKCPPRECGINEALILCIVPPKYPDPKCEPGCRCDDGYKRNKLGRCIPQEFCSKCTKPHEYYEPCAKSYSPQTCDSIDKVYPCPKLLKTSDCRGDCKCEPDYYRNPLGQCISREDCLKCRGPHEYFTCGGACDNVCENLSNQNQTSCPIINKTCNKKCYCEKGFARNFKNICVPFEDCESKCGVNEEYSECINGGCFGGKNCSKLGAPIRCVRLDPESCIKGCICKKGFLRADNGKCIQEEKCCDKKHEVFSKCINGGCYGARNCTEKGRPDKCYETNPEDCKKGCLCEKGFLRDQNGTCILEKKCPSKCKKPNEVLEDCPGNCPARTCGIDDRLVRCAKPLEVGDPKCSPPTCRCASGFFRNPEGYCVKWEECPVSCKHHKEDD